MGRDTRREWHSWRWRGSAEIKGARRALTKQLEDATSSSAPFAGDAAAEALDVKARLIEDDLRQLVAQFDYGQMVHLSLCADNADYFTDQHIGLSLLRLVHESATNGKWTLDRRDHASLYKRVLHLEQLIQMLEYVRAGLLEITHFDGHDIELKGHFDLNAWHESILMEVPLALGSVQQDIMYADPMSRVLLDVINKRAAHLPGPLADIDAAMRHDYDFGVSELLLVLHLLWSSTYRGRSGEGLSFLGYRGHIVGVLESACLEYPWLGERANLHRLIDFLTIPYGSKARGRGFRYGYGWLTPLVELPFDYVPNGFEGAVIQPNDREGETFGWVRVDDRVRFAVEAAVQLEASKGNPAIRDNTFLMTSDAALRNALQVWREILLDGEWPFDKAESPHLVRAVRDRRQRERPIAEFETAVPLALCDLGLSVWSNLEPSCDGTSNELGLALRNEIDVLAVDEKRKVIWVVEVKDLVRCWTGASVATRVGKYINEFVPKLERKRDDVADGLDALVETIGGRTSDWSVRGCFVTRYRDPAACDGRVKYPVIPVGFCHVLLGAERMPKWFAEKSRRRIRFVRSARSGRLR